jgi:CRP/FNR family cyclic AMP-dependent transcriptional regulator
LVAKPIDRRELLKSIPMFEGIDDRDLDRLLALTTTKKLERREFLFRKGDPGATVFAVMKGRLRTTGEGADGKEVVFGYSDPGEVIGEIALLDGEPRSATIQALEPTQLLTLHRRDLIPFLEKNPKVAVQLAVVMATRLRRVSEQVEDTVSLGLPTRLAKKLLTLARSYGVDEGEGLRIDLKLPQHELGELVGTSRESINKQLRSWSEDGLVSFERGYVTIRDREGLEALAGLVLS